MSYMSAMHIHVVSLRWRAIQHGGAQHARCSLQDAQVAMHDVIKKGLSMTFFTGLLASYGWLVCYGGRLIRSLLIGNDTII